VFFSCDCLFYSITGTGKSACKAGLGREREETSLPCPFTHGTIPTKYFCSNPCVNFRLKKLPNAPVTSQKYLKNNQNQAQM
jgi:hypothetical protein